MQKTIWEHLKGEHIAEIFMKLMEEKFPDFAPVRDRYLHAMERLGKNQETEMAAIDAQLRSLVLFSGALGLKANLDHYIDPVARSFLDVDAEVYLREETAHRLPAYENAQQARNAFFARLSPEEQEIYGDVLEYTCYLETVAPKLAHYYGYLLGNELLPQIIPGYHPDAMQTARYAATLNRYWKT